MPVTLAPHPEAARLVESLRRLRHDRRGRPINEILYRFAAPRHAAWPDLVSGAGSRLRGSRWNPPGHASVLHGAISPEAALVESLASRRRFGLPDTGALPLILRSVRCRLESVLDLTDGSIRVSIRVSEERMIETAWEADNSRGQEALTRAVGRAALAAGFEGLLVPSAAAPGTRSLVVFIDHLFPGSRVQLEEG